MIKGKNEVLQAFLGTLLTWGLTAAGAGLVFIFSTGKFKNQRKVLDTSLGFAAGVMTAASFWSLIAPGIEMAEKSGKYGKDGKYAFVPAAIGFALGGVFVFLSDLFIARFGVEKGCMGNEWVKLLTGITCTWDHAVNTRGKDPAISLAMHTKHKEKRVDDSTNVTEDELKAEESLQAAEKIEMGVMDSKPETSREVEHQKKTEKYHSWKRMILLIVAITVHNIPEGLAIGVAFGAISNESKQPNSTSDDPFTSARNLAIGIGIQNFPEGMAVSIPLAAAGYTPLKSFWYGQMSGMVEPISGVLGALIVVVFNPILPYALTFAAGAMIYVVVDDLIPEGNTSGNGQFVSLGAMIGFIIMMILDVALG